MLPNAQCPSGGLVVSSSHDQEVQASILATRKRFFSEEPAMMNFSEYSEKIMEESILSAMLRL